MTTPEEIAHDRECEKLDYPDNPYPVRCQCSQRRDDELRRAHQIVREFRHDETEPLTTTLEVMVSAYRQRAAALAASEQRAKEESQIVDRCWKALGIETYEQAGGKAIDEIIADNKTKLQASERALEIARKEIVALDPKAHRR